MSASRRPSALLSSACLEAGADLSWLLERHCYVRAVSVERRPVSGEESTMAKCVIKGPSGRKWTVAEQRFLALEQMFRQPSQGAAGGAEGSSCCGGGGGGAQSSSMGARPSKIFGSDGSIAEAEGLVSGGASGGASGGEPPRIVEVCADSGGGVANAATSALPTEGATPAAARVAGFSAGVPPEAGRIAGSGLAAALALGTPGGAHAGARFREPGGSGRRMSGVVDVLKTAIESTASREQLSDLYGAVLLAGCGGGLPGMRQRMEAELRLIRNDPAMPRALRPRLVETPSTLAGGIEARVSSLGAQGGVANGDAGGPAAGRRGGGAETSAGGGGSGRSAAGGGAASGGGSSLCGSVSETLLQEAEWAVSEAETVAWRGAAEEALSGSRNAGVGNVASIFSSGSTNGDWVLADQFRRNPQYATRAAFKAAGCVNMEAVGQAERRSSGDHWAPAGALRGGPMLRT